MPDCKCACHENVNWVGRVGSFFMSFFRASVWASIIIFFCAGTISSMMVLVKLYPELSEMILPFVEFSGLLMRFALVTFVIGIVFSFLYWIFYGRNKHLTQEVNNK